MQLELGDYGGDWSGLFPVVVAGTVKLVEHFTKPGTQTQHSIEPIPTPIDPVPQDPVPVVPVQEPAPAPFLAAPAPILDDESKHDEKVPDFLIGLSWNLNLCDFASHSHRRRLKISAGRCVSGRIPILASAHGMSLDPFSLRRGISTRIVARGWMPMNWPNLLLRRANSTSA